MSKASFKPPASGSGSFPMPDEGQHAFRLRGVIDMGTIKDPKFGTRKHEIKLLFELVDTSANFGEGKENLPFELSKKFTFSLSEKANMLKFFNQWRGKKMKEEDIQKFDLVPYVTSQWPGYCIVEHIDKKEGDGKMAVINNVMPAGKEGKEFPKLRNPSILFLIDDKSTHDSFKLFSHRKYDLQRLQQAEEFKKIAYLWNTISTESAPEPDMSEEDLPF